jgi:hypothetical protein
MLAPRPNPEIPEAPATKASVPVRTVAVPGGLMLERTDVPQEPLTGSPAARGSQAQAQKQQYRTIDLPNGRKMLEPMDMPPAPATAEVMDPGAFVEQTGESGQRVLVLRDQTPPPPRPGTVLWIRAIPARSGTAAMPSEPEPNVLYRVVQPGDRP